jgi:predicted RNA-binding Zn ribbon-like protein
METLIPVGQLRLVGGDLALDYLNTRSGPAGAAPDAESLHRYDDLLAWARRVDLLTGPAARKLLERAGREPHTADETYWRALTLRDHLDAVFTPIARGGRPATLALDELRRATSEALAHADLKPGEQNYTWHWGAGDDLASPLWPVAAAASRLLTTGPLRRVKGCAACRFLFIDESKNGSRRWCSMDDCGRADKIRKYVARRAAARL